MHFGSFSLGHIVLNSSCLWKVVLRIFAFYLNTEIAKGAVMNTVLRTHGKCVVLSIKFLLEPREQSN